MTERPDTQPLVQTPRRELYSALMDGLGDDDRGKLEQLMHDNEERLRDTGDGYAP